MSKVKSMAESKVKSMAESKKNKVQLQVKVFKLSELNPAGYNPRTISEEAMEGLTASIKKFGYVEPIVVNIRGGKNIIIGGNQRFKVLSEIGIKECHCITVSLDKSEEKLLNLTLNNPHVRGEFIDGLGKYIEEIKLSMPNSTDLLELKIQKLQTSIGGNTIDCLYKKEELKPYRKTHILLSFSPELLLEIAEYLEKIIEIEGIEYEQGSN